MKKKSVALKSIPKLRTAGVVSSRQNSTRVRQKDLTDDENSKKDEDAVELAVAEDVPGRCSRRKSAVAAMAAISRAVKVK